MSRVAKATILIPDGVKVKINNNLIIIKGKNGELNKNINENIIVKYENNSLNFLPKVINKYYWALAGTTRSLIHKMIIGVSQGFIQKLQLFGVGYRAIIQENKVVLSLGLSHNILYKIPENIKISCPSQTEIIIQGIDKQLVKQVAADIRAYKKPDPYKGKGIRYDKELIRIKESKKK